MTVRCPSNSHSASSTSGLLAPAAQSSAGRAACSCLSWPAVMPRRPHRPLLLPPLAQGIPLLTHTPCYSAATAASHGSRTSEPSYSSPRGHPLPRLPRLLVVPFLGLAVVHRLGALGAAWSTWSTTFHRKSTVHGEADSWVHGHSPVFCDLPSKSLCQAYWAANLSRRGELSFGWPRKWPISNEKWAIHF